MSDVPHVEVAQAVAMHDLLLANQPEGARHDSSICPVCVDKAQAESPPSRIPPGGDAGPDVSDDNQTSPTNTEGGTTEPMSDNANTMSQETHDALVKKAVDDAVKASDAALATANEKIQELSSANEGLETKVSQLETDNADLNKRLDEAQVAEKAATEKAEQLEKDITERDEKAAKAELASKRADQVRNLKLFTDEQIAEKASRWAELSEDDFAERLEEWKSFKPAEGDGSSTSTDSASAMSGSSEQLTSSDDSSSQDQASGSTTEPAPRRAVLGLS